MLRIGTSRQIIMKRLLQYDVFITEKRDDKVSDEVIKKKLVKYYKLTEEEAEGYLAGKGMVASD